MKKLVIFIRVTDNPKFYNICSSEDILATRKSMISILASILQKKKASLLNPIRYLWDLIDAEWKYLCFYPKFG